MSDNLSQDLRRAARAPSEPGTGVGQCALAGPWPRRQPTLFSCPAAAFFYQPEVADAGAGGGRQPGNSNQYSYLNFRDLQESGIFESVAGFRRVQLNLRVGGEPERVPGLAVTADFFTALGIPAGIGRTFDAAEAAPERQPRIAVLSHRVLAAALRWECRHHRTIRQ